MPRVLCVVPAYNEEGTIEEVLEGIKKYEGEYIDEIVVIDDASQDKTRQICLERDVGIVTHPINQGVGGAVQTGYDLAILEDYDYLVQIDGDGQHKPKYIDRLREKIEEGFDMVIGSRYLNESYKEFSLVRRTGISFFTWLINWLAGTEITDITSGYRIYRVEMLNDLGKIHERHWAIEQTLEAARKDFRITEISIEMPEREQGKSQFDLKTFLNYPLQMIKGILKVFVYR